MDLDKLCEKLVKIGKRLEMIKHFGYLSENVERRPLAVVITRSFPRFTDLARNKPNCEPTFHEVCRSLLDLRYPKNINYASTLSLKYIFRVYTAVFLKIKTLSVKYLLPDSWFINRTGEHYFQTYVGQTCVQRPLKRHLTSIFWTGVTLLQIKSNVGIYCGSFLYWILAALSCYQKI